jgi:hypothetical protein
MPQQGIRLFARKRHYRDHLLPIWEKLPAEYKLEGPFEQFDRLLIAGGPDIRHGHPYVYVEHGAGQSYAGVSVPGYSGGNGHEECELFICPNSAVAARWLGRYPNKPVAVVGCPRLDKYHGHVPPPRTVAVTFHFDLPLVPETRNAFKHYQASLGQVVNEYRSQGWRVLGHAHPRLTKDLKPTWERLGVEWTPDPLRDASVLIADNTSLLAEFLALGRPAVALNAPWYRRDVWHGGRFWEWPLVYIDGPDDLLSLVLDELSPPGWHPYAYADGRASERAVAAISSLLESDRPYESRRRTQRQG